MRRALLLVLGASLVLPGASAASPLIRPTFSAPAPARTSIFYYPWYGTPASDGRFVHWAQNGAQPPHTIASAYFPARGLYSSGDALVLGAQMRDIRASGLQQVATSWWGAGSLEDERLPAILAAARAVGLDVAAHLEPYEGRTAASTEADIAALRTLGITDFYVYGPHDVGAANWAEANARLEGVRVFAQTALAGFAAAAGFDGLYTYDVLVFGGRSFARLCAQAHTLGLLCAPSVGPGYDAQRSVGDARVKPRRNGRTYDEMWTAALRAGSDLVTVTSYNEWHEGTQIEPARARPGYAAYTGAWGLRGAAAERAYIDRTAHWAARLAGQ